MTSNHDTTRFVGADEYAMVLRPTVVVNVRTLQSAMLLAIRNRTDESVKRFLEELSVGDFDAGERQLWGGIVCEMMWTEATPPPLEFLVAVGNPNCGDWALLLHSIQLRMAKDYHRVHWDRYSLDLCQHRDPIAELVRRLVCVDGMFAGQAADLDSTFYCVRTSQPPAWCDPCILDCDGDLLKFTIFAAISTCGLGYVMCQLIYLFVVEPLSSLLRGKLSGIFTGRRRQLRHSISI